MSQIKKIKLEGVIPATLIAFDEDFEINENASRKHIKECALTKGISAITVNGHSSEIHACNFEEQKTILNFSLDEIGDVLPVINGVYADGSIEAAKIAKMSDLNGASALLCFPPQSMSMGGYLRPEMAIEHFSRIADASDLPLICFNYPSSGNLTYPFETLLQLFEKIPSIKAIKDWSNDPMLHEKHIKTFQNLSNPVNVLTTHSSWLMSSLVMGAKGLLSGAGSVIASLQVDLFLAIKNNDLKTAQKINDKMYPLVQAFYSPPFLDMHNRMKETLVLLGLMEKAIVRPPLMKLGFKEITALEKAIK
ncbi:MAG: dihydrodipicolinate synthase family protein, partial [Alphaproteobacteria bacterium]|nr:dihydrodipicolinate synthase family protein [Alphaproteobacteria bacterium]